MGQLYTVGGSRVLRISMNYNNLEELRREGNFRSLQQKVTWMGEEGERPDDPRASGHKRSSGRSSISADSEARAVERPCKGEVDIWGQADRSRAALAVVGQSGGWADSAGPVG